MANSYGLEALAASRSDTQTPTPNSLTSPNLEMFSPRPDNAHANKPSLSSTLIDALGAGGQDGNSTPTPQRLWSDNPLTNVLKRLYFLHL